MVKVVEKIPQQGSLLHHKDLKATVASMKAYAKAQCSKVVDIAEDRDFLQKGKALVQFCVCYPIMKLT